MLRNDKDSDLEYFVKTVRAVKYKDVTICLRIIDWTLVNMRNTEQRMMVYSFSYKEISISLLIARRN